MADERAVSSVKIVDPTTTTQIAGVDASGNLQVILAANTGVDIGDVDVLSVIPGFGGTNLGKRQDDPSTAADVGVASLVLHDAVLSALGTIDDDYTWLRVDANGALWTHDDVLEAALAGSELQVDVVAALPTGTNEIGDIGSILTAVVPGVGALNLGKAEDAGHTTGDVGVMMLGVRNDIPTALTTTDLDYSPLATDAQGHLQVDVLTGGGVDTPTNPTFDNATSAAVGAGSSADLQSTDLGGTTKKLTQLVVSASVPFKVILTAEENGAIVITYVTLFGQANTAVVWEPPHRNYASRVFAANAAFDGFQAEVKNQDTSEAADVYASFLYED